MAIFGDIQFREEEAAAAAAASAPTEAAPEPIDMAAFANTEAGRQEANAAVLQGTHYRQPLSTLFKGEVDEEPTYDYEEPSIVTPDGKKQLIRDEGQRLSAYKDSKGIYTIGVGFNLEEPANAKLFEQTTGFSAEEAKQGKPITAADSAALLDVTVQRAEADARSLLPSFAKLSDKDQDAFVNFVFNVGRGTASQFKNTLAALNRGDGKAAAAGLRASAYYKQVGARGERVAKALETLEPRPAVPVAPAPESAAKKPAEAPAVKRGVLGGMF